MNLSLDLALGGSAQRRRQPRILSIQRFQADDAANVNSWSFAGSFSSVYGNVAVLFASRCNAVTAPTVNFCNWGGFTITQRAFANLDGTNRGFVWAGARRRVPSGVQTLNINLTAIANRDLIGWVVDLDVLAPTPAGHALGAVYNGTGVGSLSVDLVPTKQGTLCLGVVAAHNDTAHPLAVSGSGWSLLDGGKTASGGTNDIAAGLAVRTQGLPGAATLTGTANGAVTAANWAAVAMELLPA